MTDSDKQIVHVNSRDIATGKDVTIETYDGRSVLANVGAIQQLVPGTSKGSPLEIAAFLQFCLANRYDPFRKQVYFIKYDAGSPASWVVSWNVYLDRASRHPQYNGMENGIVWEVNGEVIRGQPCDHDPGEDKVRMLGGWARVHRKDREHPAYVEVPLNEMQKRTSTWIGMTTTMATKTPTARALRIAFTEELGLSYTEGEIVATETEVSVDVPTREARADPDKPICLLAVVDAVEGLVDERYHHSDYMVDIVSKLAARATGRKPEDFGDDSAWTPEVCQACLDMLAEYGIEPEWLPGEDEGATDEAV